MTMLTLDHIAIAATDLDGAVPGVETALGVPLAPGGQHAAMGTHNRLLSLGADAYLELIAIDPAGARPGQPRWFDLDRFNGPTRSRAWICRCPDLDAAIAAAPDGIGVPWALERADLRWRMAVPRDGILPFGGLFPALIEWHGPAHPAPRLPDHGIRLTALRLISPEADALSRALAPMIADPRVEVVYGAVPAITATLQTPLGEVTL